MVEPAAQSASSSFRRFSLVIISSSSFRTLCSSHLKFPTSSLKKKKEFKVEALNRSGGAKRVKKTLKMPPSTEETFFKGSFCLRQTPRKMGLRKFQSRGCLRNDGTCRWLRLEHKPLSSTTRITLSRLQSVSTLSCSHLSKTACDLKSTSSHVICLSMVCICHFLSDRASDGLVD